jgi:hypothetical protein
MASPQVADAGTPLAPGSGVTSDDDRDQRLDQLELILSPAIAMADESTCSVQQLQNHSNGSQPTQRTQAVPAPCARAELAAQYGVEADELATEASSCYWQSELELRDECRHFSVE